MKQLDLNLSGKELKEVGIQRAIDKAERVSPGWANVAFHLFTIWIRKRKEPFRMEEFREWCKDLINTPPSLRAFGSIVRRAKKEGLVKHIGYTQVENPKAHAANSSLWQRV